MCGGTDGPGCQLDEPVDVSVARRIASKEDSERVKISRALFMKMSRTLLSVSEANEGSEASPVAMWA